MQEVRVSLKALVNNYSLYTAFTDYLNERISVEQSKLETSSTMEDVFRHQGSIKALRRLLKLREEINGSE